MRRLKPAVLQAVSSAIAAARLYTLIEPYGDLPPMVALFRPRFRFESDPPFGGFVRRPPSGIQLHDSLDRFLQ
jgi:hypothetical protein